MRSILVLNAKGGSGKTTVATNLAGYYASEGAKVVLADYDPQGSSIDWVAQRPEQYPKITGIEAFRTGLRVPRSTDVVVMDAPSRTHEEQLVPLLKGQSPKNWRTSIYYHYYEYPSFHMVPRHYGIRTERYKLMHFYRFGNEWEMYDLQKDPDELTNLYGQLGQAKLTADLKKQLYALQKHYGDESDLSEMPKEWKDKVRPGTAQK